MLPPNNDSLLWDLGITTDCTHNYCLLLHLPLKGKSLCLAVKTLEEHSLPALGLAVTTHVLLGSPGDWWGWGGGQGGWSSRCGRRR